MMLRNSPQASFAGGPFMLRKGGPMTLRKTALAGPMSLRTGTVAAALLVSISIFGNSDQ
jgi:hypothetical protein